MLWRLFRFFLFQAVGAGLGFALWRLDDSFRGALAGSILAGVVWVLIDLRRGLKLLRWLQQGQTAQLPELPGLWGEVGARTRALLRARDQQLAQSETRLSEFLAAIQTSPNGVVLLDAQGRIEWCNRTAAEHFGFDPQRDLGQHLGNLLRDPVFAAYQSEHDFSHAVVIPGPRSTVSRPVKLSVDLHAYGDGCRLLL